MKNNQGVSERRIGITIADREFALFWQRRGPPFVRQRRSLLPWVLPLLSATGIAIAMPVAHKTGNGQVTMTLDDPVTVPAKAPRANMQRAAAPKYIIRYVRQQPAEMPVGGGAFLPREAALAKALKTGEPTDWLDMETGANGVVVPGAADAKGCRDVVVMTHRADGNNDNLPSRECRKS